MNTTSSWKRIRTSLDEYAPEPLEARLREVLSPMRDLRPLGGKFPKGELTPWRYIAEEALQKSLGPWYTESGLPLGNESIGGYCWCHSFFNQAPETQLDLDDNIRFMLVALERIRSFLYALDRVFIASRREVAAAGGDEGLRRKALAEGMVRTVELTAKETVCEEAWYGVANQALEWWFDVLELPLSDAAQDRMSEGFVFESWIAPEPEALRKAAARVAEVL
jgi:hypothetical protein